MNERLRRILADVMPLRRGEWRLALFLYGVLTLMVAADWVGKLGADALFVKRFGVNEIPKMYIVTPIVMLAVSALIFYFVDRVRRRTMLLWYVAAVTVSSLLIQWVISSGATGVIQPISYIFAHGVKETIYILFWVYAGNLYDVEQSKRLFPFFAGSVLVGKILGGAIGAAIAPVVHAENFIGAQAVGFAVCFIAILLYRNLPEGEGRHARVAHRPTGLRDSLRETVDGYRTVGADRLLRVFGVGVFFWYFLMQFANFLYLVGLDQSSATATSRVGQEDVFSILYASVYTSASLVALGIQSLMTTPLVRRFGVARVLFALPIWYVASYGVASYAYGGDVGWLVLPAVIALQLGERIVIPAVHRPATELVYSQISAAIRPRARAFLSGGVNALGNMAAAIALIVGIANLSTTALLAAGAGASLLYGVNTWQTRRAFGQRIAENLSSQDVAMRRNAVEMLHAEGAAVPTELLRTVAEEGSDEVAHGARLALTRRGALAVAVDSAE